MIRYLAVSVALVFLLTTVTYSQGMERDLSIKADGDIEYESVAGSPAGEVVTVVEGKGEIDYTDSVSADEDSLSRDAEIEYVSEDELTVIVGSKTTKGTYVSGVEGGEGAISQSFSIENDEFAEMVHNLEAVADMSLYRHEIDVETAEARLKEMLQVEGYTEISDLLEFGIDE